MSDEPKMIDALRANWVERDIPSFFSDGVVGIANAGGVQRLTFFEMLFNTAADPRGLASRPVVSIAMPTQRLRDTCLDILRLLDEQRTEAEAEAANANAD